jgi:hypothetical protein
MEWNTSAIASTLEAIHLSGSRMNHDDHAVIDSYTPISFLEAVSRITQISNVNGVIVLEQSNHVEMLESLKYLKKKWIQKEWIEF